jgi:hypothetical protein
MLRSILAALLLVIPAISSAQYRVSYLVPNFPDLMIKTRSTFGIQSPRQTVLFLKGPRQRMEYGPSIALRDNRSFAMATITQCDQGDVYHLNSFNKTYMMFHERLRDLPQDSTRPTRHLTDSAPAVTGTEVVVTIDSVDTGERRDYGSYQARHVKTTVTVEPGKGADSLPGRADIDGWYIDLPGLNCHEEQMESLLPPMAMVRPGRHEHRTIKRLGTAPHGFTVQETAKIKEGGNIVINKTELLTISEDQLDPLLFELPEGYTERQQVLFHGTVMLPLTQGLLKATP